MDATVSSFHAYDFDNDPEFQQGLSAILAQNPNPDLAPVKLFYFNRLKGTTLTPADVNPSDPPQLSFAQLQALIESGKLDEIPNNKPISGELNPDPPSDSKATLRKKPWERDDSEA